MGHTARHIHLWACLTFVPGVQSKKRGLSIDEKKQKVLEIFHESKEVFVLKVHLAVWTVKPLGWPWPVP